MLPNISAPACTAAEAAARAASPRGSTSTATPRLVQTDSGRRAGNRGQLKHHRD